MNRSQRNNNPINLRFAGQFEARGQDDDHFAIFPSPMAGWRAAFAQIKLDQSRNLTLRQYIFKFAPPSENDTNAYLDFVCHELHRDADYWLVDFSPYALAVIQAAYEGYFKKEDL